MDCPACGRPVDGGSPCPSCGATVAAARPSERPLLLPSGPRGAIVALVFAALLFAGIWLVFDRLAPDTDPAASPPLASTTPSTGAGVATTPPPSPPAASPSATSAGPSPSPSPTDPTSPWEPVLADVGRAAVEVLVTTCDGDRREATGFQVAPGRLVTSAGALAEAERIVVRRGPRSHVARVLGRNRDLDLALLVTDDPVGSATLAFVERSVAVGQRVAAVRVDRAGRPRAVPGTVSGVDVAVVTRRGRLSNVVRTDTASDRSLRGAALLAPGGRVAGVVLTDHVTSASPNLGFAVAASTVADRVSTWSTRSTPPPPPRCAPRSTPDPGFESPGSGSGSGPASGSGSNSGGASEPGPTPSPEASTPDTRAGANWIAVLVSLPTGQFDQADARRRARDLGRRLPANPSVLHSSDYGSLNPGYWVVYTGPYGRIEDARAACAAFGPTTQVCYARRLRQ